MQAERDYLRNHVFPRLEEKLRERRHWFEPIDLRLGVETVSLATEEAREMKVLKVCLEEIERSRPFLIVLLGDRYGWVPATERLRAAALEQGFIDVRTGQSVTALEIEFGLIKADSQQRQRSFIYLRDPLPYDRMSGLAGVYSDAHSADPDALEHVRQLNALKTRLQADHELVPRIRTYRAEWDDTHQRVVGLKDWGERVFQDLWAELDETTRAFAIAPPQTWQQRERAAARDFVEQSRRGFTGREPLLTDLLALARSPDLPEHREAPFGACVIGGPGSGKSALVSELCARLSTSDDTVILVNAAGGTPRGGSTDAMLRRFIGELSQALQIDDPLTENARPDELDGTFASLLARAAQHQRVVVLLDAINQFDATPRAQQLTWLRVKQWPTNARIIATALPESPGAVVLAKMERVRTIHMPELTAPDIADVAKRVWARYHREINPELVEVLQAKRRPDGMPSAGNPLWLTLALEQLNLLDTDDFRRAYRTYPGTLPAEQLHLFLLDTVNQMPPDVPGLYNWLLDAGEKAYGQPDARAFAVLIALARFGWRESDLLPLIPVVGRLLFPLQEVRPLDDLGVATLRRGFRAHLVRHGASDQLDFSHAQMREAVVTRLGVAGASIAQLHQAIADHLLGLRRDDPLHESETMVHLVAADDRPRAAAYYARDLTPGEEVGATAALLAILEQEGSVSPLQPLERAQWIASLTHQVSEPAVLTALCHRFLHHLDAAARSSGILAPRVPLLKAVDAALDNLCHNPSVDPNALRELSVCRGYTADIILEQGDVTASLALARDALSIAEALARTDPSNAGGQADVSACQHRIGNACVRLRDSSGALAAYTAACEISERIAALDPLNHRRQGDLALSWAAMGEVHIRIGHSAAGLSDYRTALGIVERLQLANPTEVDWARRSSEYRQCVGNILATRGDSVAALSSYREALAICERLLDQTPGDSDLLGELASAQQNVGDALRDSGRLAEAVAAYQLAAAVQSDQALKDPTSTLRHQHLATLHSRIGGVLLAQGKTSEALAVFRSALDVTEQLARDYPENLSFSHDASIAYAHIGDALAREGETLEALQAYRSAVTLAKQCADRDPSDTDAHGLLSAAYQRMGDVLRTTGELNAALQAYASGAAVGEHQFRSDEANAAVKRGLVVNYNKHGEALQAAGDVARSLQLYRKALILAQELAEADPTHAAFQHALHSCYMHVGEALRLEGGMAEALSSYRRGLGIAQQLTQIDPSHRDWQRDLVLCHNAIGDIMYHEGDSVGALQEYRTAASCVQRLASEEPANTEWQRDRAVSEIKIADVLRDRGEGERAYERYQSALGIITTLAHQDAANVERQQDLVLVSIKAGDTAHAAGDDVTALRTFRRAVPVAQALLERDPANAEAQHHLAVLYSNIGAVLLARGNQGGAREMLERTLPLQLSLADQDPTNLQRRRAVAVCQNRMGALLRAEGRLVEALAAFHEDLAITRYLVRSDPTNAIWQHDLVLTQMAIGGVLHALGESDAAATTLMDARTAAEQLTKLDPANVSWLETQAKVYRVLGEILSSLGRDGALEVSRADHDIQVRLSSTRPVDAQSGSQLGISRLRLGDRLLEQRSAEQALRCFEDAAQVLQECAHVDPGSLEVRCLLLSACVRLARAHGILGDDAQRREYVQRCEHILTEMTQLGLASEEAVQELRVQAVGMLSGMAE